LGTIYCSIGDQNVQYIESYRALLCGISNYYVSYYGAVVLRMKLSREEWVILGICLVLLFAVIYFDFPKNDPIGIPQLVDFEL